MFYKVSRSSSYNNEQPCEGAVLKSMPHYHVRAFNSFQEFDERCGAREGTWCSKGTEHTVGDGYISRKEGYQDEWVVKISNLKQLQEFIKENGQIVLDEDSIVIYDDYIE